MADLGVFGRARADYREQGEPDVFTFHDETFEVPAGISIVVLMDFLADAEATQRDREDAITAQGKAAKAVERAVTDTARAAADEAVVAADVALVAASNALLRVLREYVRGCLPDDKEWRRFNATCRRNAVDLDELMEVCASIFSAVAARPTRRPSESSDGPSTSGGGSTGGSGSLAVTAGPPPPGMDSPFIPDPTSMVVDGTAVEMPHRKDFDVHLIPVDDLLAGRLPSGV